MVRRIGSPDGRCGNRWSGSSAKPSFYPKMLRTGLSPAAPFWPPPAPTRDIAMNAPTAFPDQKPVPPYKHTPLFPLGPDTTPYKKITAEGVRVEKVLGKDMLVVSREALRALSEAAFGDINHYLRPGPPEAVARDPGRQGSQRQRQVRRLRLPEERQHRCRRRAADVPGYRHRDHHGQEGLQRHHRRRRRGRALGRRARRLPAP